MNSVFGPVSFVRSLFEFQLSDLHPIKWFVQRRKKRTDLKQVDVAHHPAFPKRVAPRIPLQQAVTVRFTSGGHYHFTGVSRDISTSGIFILLESNVIEVGSQVEIMLTLPSKLDRPIPVHVTGKVVRIEKPSPAGIAVAFDTLVVAPTLASDTRLQEIS